MSHLPVADGDIIELATDVFKGTGNRDLDYLDRAITNRSASGGPIASEVRSWGAVKQEYR
ncbi:MAG: hypothetical protein ABIF77_17085 [bacterium]